MASNHHTRSRDIGRALDTVALALEADGYEPEEVGAAMVGFGLNLICIGSGIEKARKIVNAAREFLHADAQEKLRQGTRQ